VATDPGKQGGRQLAVADERGEQIGGLAVRERQKRQRTGPARPTVEQLRPGGAEDEQRSAGPVGEALEEVELPVVGPVNVLEHEHRAVAGPLLEEAPPRGEQLPPLTAGVRLEADEQPEVA